MFNKLFGRFCRAGVVTIVHNVNFAEDLGWEKLSKEAPERSGEEARDGFDTATLVSCAALQKKERSATPVAIGRRGTRSM
jgi:hypothetical protein